MIARMSIDRLRRHPSYLMLQLVKEARRISGALGDDGLRSTHLSVLAWIADAGPTSQKQISDGLHIDPSDLVSLLDDLENRGYAKRRRDTRDRRRYAVEITADGMTALRHRLDVADALQDVLFEPLSAREREQLTELLLKVYQHHEAQR
jgi:DNA-binding MarR family transcriptional regulator